MAASELFTSGLFNDASLVSYYRLESTADAKGSNTLTNNNTVAFNAAKFNNGGDQGASNTNKYLSRADALGLNGSNPFSRSYWIKLQTEIASATQTITRL